MSETKKAPERNAKYRVIPRLTPRGKEIGQMVRNKSIQAGNVGQYSLDEKLDEIRRKSRLDIHTDALMAKQEIRSMKNRLEDLHAKGRDEEVRELAELKREKLTNAAKAKENATGTEGK